MDEFQRVVQNLSVLITSGSEPVQLRRKWERVRALVQTVQTVNLHSSTEGTLPPEALGVESALRTTWNSMRKLQLQSAPLCNFEARFVLETQIEDDLDTALQTLEDYCLKNSRRDTGSIDEVEDEDDGGKIGHLGRWRPEEESEDKADLQEDRESLEQLMREDSHPLALEFLEISETMDNDSFSCSIRSPSSRLNEILFELGEKRRLKQFAETAALKGSDFKVDQSRTLGRGAFCEVLGGTWRGHPIAVKRPRSHEYIGREGARLRALLLSNAQTFRTLNDRNLVKIYGVGVLQKELVLVMERCDISLSTLLHERTHQQLSAEGMAKIIKGVAKGLQFLHGKSILHQDLKSVNVLLSSDMGKVKLSAFGSGPSTRSFEGGSKRNSLSPLRESVPYMAPEVLASPAIWTTKADIFSFAVLCWEILHQQFPWGEEWDMGAVRKKVLRGERPSIDSTVKHWASELTSACWRADPLNRPSSEQIVHEIESKTSKRRSTRVVRGLLSFLSPRSGKTALSNASLSSQSNPSVKQTKAGVLNAVQAMGRGDTFKSGLKHLVLLTQSDAEHASNASGQVKFIRRVALEAGVLRVLLARFQREAPASLQRQPKLCAVALDAVGYVLQVGRESYSLLDAKDLAGCIDMIVRLMVVHNQDAAVCRAGFFAATSLATCGAVSELDLFHSDLVARILEGMARFQSNVDVQAQGCIFLRYVAMGEASKAKLVEVGAIDTLLIAINEHVGEPIVLRPALAATRNLAMLEGNQALLMDKGFGDSILCSMEPNLSDARLLQYGCGALCNLAQLEKNRLELVELGVVETAVMAMKSHIRDRKLQQSACSLLAMLAREDDEIRKTILDLGGALALIASYKENSLDSLVSGAVFGAMWVLTSLQSSVPLWMEVGALVAVMSGMKAFSEDVTIQQYCCGILCHLATTNSHQKVKLMESGAPEAVLRAMRKHVMSVSVQQLTCTFLGSIAQAPQNQGPLLRLGAVDSLLTVMRIQRRSNSIQKKALAALWAIASDKGNKADMLRTGVTQSIVSTMQFHERDAQVQQLACALIWNLALAPENLEAIVDAGCVKSIARGLKAHPNQSKVQLKGCGALYALALHPSAHSAMLKRNVPNLVASAMLNHTQDAMIQEKCCGLIKRLAVSEEAVLKFEALGYAEKICFAIDAFPADDRLVEKAFQAVTALISASHECVDVFLRQEVHVAATKALERHIERVTTVKAALEALALLLQNDSSSTTFADLSEHHDLVRILELVKRRYAFGEEILSLMDAICTS